MLASFVFLSAFATAFPPAAAAGASASFAVVPSSPLSHSRTATNPFRPATAASPTSLPQASIDDIDDEFFASLRRRGRSDRAAAAARSPLFSSRAFRDLRGEKLSHRRHRRRRAVGDALKTVGKDSASTASMALAALSLGCRPAWASEVPIEVAAGGRASAAASAALSYVASLASSLPTRTISFARRSIVSPFSHLLRHPSKEAFRACVKPTLITLALFMLASNAIDSIRTRKRQRVDATSEWGRYADDPAARGRALGALCMRIMPYVVADMVLKRMPGGKLQEELDDEEAKKKKSGDEAATNDDGAGDSSILSNDDDDGEEETTTRWAARRRLSLRSSSGSRFADGLLRLGPLYIKIGQILSCRENLFPKAWISAMERLQDRVPAKSGDDALRLAYGAMPGGREEFWEVFEEFDDVPLAAASLGQVHRAKLKETGEDVAVKIQRERLRDIYDKDLALMRKIAGVADKIGGASQVGGIQQSWTDIFSDAEEILYREIDYRDEAENAARFADEFGLGAGGIATTPTAQSSDGKPLPSASSWLRTPYTHTDLSSEKMLVMEYVPSIKISDDEELDRAGVTREDREYLAECLGRAYLRQFCSHRFFSTDPHPGNLGVEVRTNGVVNGDGNVDGEGASDTSEWPRLVFYDFGQACSLNPSQADGILDVIEAIVDTDADACVSAFSKMGVLVDGADLIKVTDKVRSNFETGKVKSKRRASRMLSGRRRGKRTTQSRSAEEGGAADIKAASDPLRQGAFWVEDFAADEAAVTDTEVDVERGTAATEPAANATTSQIPFVEGFDSDTKAPPSDEVKEKKKKSSKGGSKNDAPKDSEVMEYFTLPAEYAFVARAISQMDGVGRGLDPDFDFISASAPHLVEIRGASNYLIGEAKKRVLRWERDVARWQKGLLGRFGFDPKVYMKGKEVGSGKGDVMAEGEGDDGGAAQEYASIGEEG